MWRPYIVGPLSVAAALLLSAGMQSASIHLTDHAPEPAASATPAPIPGPPPPLPASHDTRSHP
jgi:hypothetical protein